MFSQTTEYALRAVVCLAQSPGQYLTTGQIAQRTLVPAGYLSKVMQGLCRGNLVIAHRGLHGGHELARPADQITILDVVNSVEPFKRITQCPLGLTEHGANLCPLHRKMDSALAQVEEAFATTTLADLLSDQSANVPLCPVPGTS